MTQFPPLIWNATFTTDESSHFGSVSGRLSPCWLICTDDIILHYNQLSDKMWLTFNKLSYVLTQTLVQMNSKLFYFIIKLILQDSDGKKYHHPTYFIIFSSVSTDSSSSKEKGFCHLYIYASRMQNRVSYKEYLRHTYLNEQMYQLHSVLGNFRTVRMSTMLNLPHTHFF